MPPAYELLLLNTAIPQIQAAQSGDTYVVPRDIAFSAALTLSAGTANGVPYLNASKVLTTGSALTFDGTNLKVGNATFAPNTNLAGNLLQLKSASGFAYLTMGNGDGANNTGYIGSASGLLTFGSVTDAGVTTEGMRLTSTGLGIGTNNPTQKLQVEGAANSAASTLLRLNNSGTTSGGPGIASRISFTAGATALGFIQGSNFASGATGLQFSGDGTNAQATLDTSGNLGLGVTPSTISAGRNLEVGFAGSGIYSYSQTDTEFLSNAYYNAGYKFGGTGRAMMYAMGLSGSGIHSWHTSTVSGTAGNAISFTQAMTLDALGNLGIGTTSPGARLDVVGNYARFSENASGAEVYLRGYYASVAAAIQVVNNFPLLFLTNNVERARITSGGYFKASNNGTYADSTGGYHEFYQTNNTDTVRVTSTSTAVSGAYGVYVDLTTDPNATDSFFLRCYGGANQRASIRSNGGLANYQSNNVDLSDIRTKTDISPLASYWNKIAALEIVTYKYKDQTHDDLNIGVIAQQVEQVAPEFVDPDGFGETPEDGVPLKTIYNKDLTFAAIKALQEAMARIEKLEAEVAALKGA